MRDAISFERAKLLHPAIRNEVIATLTAIEAAKFPPNISIRIVQGLRTFEEQDALFLKKPKVTNSKGGQSYHNYGLAIDFALLIDGKLTWDIKVDNDKDGEADWMEVVDSFEGLNYTWGGRFHSITDNPHLEKTFGLNWRAMLAKYNAGDFISGTKYINIT